MAEVFRWETSPMLDVSYCCIRVYFLQLLRNVAVERREDRPHIERTLTFQYLLLEFHLRIYPSLRKRSVKCIYIIHPVPGKMCRTSEIGTDFRVCQAVLTPYILPYSLLTCICERHSIAECTIIKEKRSFTRASTRTGSFT